MKFSEDAANRDSLNGMQTVQLQKKKKRLS